VISTIARLQPCLAVLGRNNEELSTQLHSQNKATTNATTNASASADGGGGTYMSVVEICNQVNFEQAVKCGAALFSLLVTRNTATHVRVSAAEALSALARSVQHTRMVNVVHVCIYA
jgi:hypothetical protein